MELVVAYALLGFVQSKENVRKIYYFLHTVKTIYLVSLESLRCFNYGVYLF